jgi:hypothetical protein
MRSRLNIGLPRAPGVSATNAGRPSRRPSSASSASGSRSPRSAPGQPAVVVDDRVEAVERQQPRAGVGEPAGERRVVLALVVEALQRGAGEADRHGHRV